MSCTTTARLTMESNHPLSLSVDALPGARPYTNNNIGDIGPDCHPRVK
ncbi:MAG TPA: hypothetical protein HPP80_01065 [Rhodospirillaceae bacterium]|nr:hypothetical protein [Rhodospirillaceae bacterium]